MKNRNRLSNIALAALALAFASSSALAVPVSQWDLDEPSGTTGVGSVVDSVGGFNGTPTGTVTFGASGARPFTGTAASFAGTGSIDVPYNAAENPASFTATAWANVTPGSGSHRSVITSRDDVAGITHGYIIYANPSNVWQFWTGDGDPGWDTLDGGAVTPGAWTHLAISFDAGSSTKSFYVNGNLVNSTTGQGYTPNTADPLHIGGGADDGTQFRFHGQIDDVRTFNTALSGSEILSIAAGGPLNNVSAGKSYSYSVLPQFDGGTFYFDDPHVQTPGAYDSGDLTDGATHPSGNAPTVPNPSTIVGWGGNSPNIATEIIMDLEDIFEIDLVQIGTHTWAPFANGAPDDVTVSFSTTGDAPGDFGNAIFKTFVAPTGDGHWDLSVFVDDIAARYVKLAFDGGAVLTGNTANKWMLDEITIFGTTPATIPEPASASLLLLAGIGMMRRRRRAV